MTASANQPTPWVIVGCGRLGTALAFLAESLEIPVLAAWDRDGPPAVPAQQRLSGPLQNLERYVHGAAVILTVSDEAIAAVAAALGPMLDRAELVAHCSGSLASTVLSNAGVTVPVASVHPLLAVADPLEAAARFADAAWTVEGTSAAVWWARGWLSKLDVDPATVSAAHKSLYHAAAVTSAGLVVALMDTAFEMGEAAGLTRAQARRMLVPLARSSLDNLIALDSADALTGPIARGDEHTVAQHLVAMPPGDARDIYELLTERSRKIARRLDE